MKAKKLKKSKGITLPTEKTVTASKVKDYIQLFYGPPGVGKTTLAENLSERTFFISTDRGTRYMPAFRVEVNSCKDIIGVIDALTSPSSPKYDIVCLDHIDDILVMIEDQVCDDLGIESLSDAAWAKGWKAYKKYIWHILQTLLKLDVGIVFICHETIKTVRTRLLETERTMPDIGKSGWKVIVPKCDLVGYCGFKTVRMKGGEKAEIRIVETVPREDLYAKDRTTRIKPEKGWEKLDGKLFIKSFVGKVKKHGKKNKTI